MLYGIKDSVQQSQKSNGKSYPTEILLFSSHWWNFLSSYLEKNKIMHSYAFK